jgi:hypothetical protein
MKTRLPVGFLLLPRLFFVLFVRSSFPSVFSLVLEILFDVCLRERAVCVPFPFDVSLYFPPPAFEAFAFLDLDSAALTSNEGPGDLGLRAFSPFSRGWVDFHDCCIRASIRLGFIQQSTKSPSQNRETTLEDVDVDVRFFMLLKESLKSNRSL